MKQTGRLTPCLQQKIDKTRYLVEVHFSATSTQSVEDKLKRVILHDLETIQKYLKELQRNKKQMEKLNKLRKLAGTPVIA